MGPGSFARLGEVCGEYAPGRALVVTDEGISATDGPRRACSMLSDAGLRPWVMADVLPNPRVADVDRMADLARREQPTVVVALGGGSVIDAAKAIALLLTNPGSCRDYEGANRFSRPPAPIVAIPTTCGTGSEVTWVSVVSDASRKVKISVKGEGLFPSWAIVDADLLTTLPASLVAATGMDALTHAIEAFVGRAANPVSDYLAAAAVRLVGTSLVRAVVDPEDREARAGMMEASTLAGMSFGNSDVGAVHCLSEAIGGLLDLPHGLLNAILLAPVLRHQGESISEPLGRLGALAGVQEIIPWVETAGAAAGIPPFAALGIQEQDFAAIAEAAAANGSNKSNRKAMTGGDYLAILQGLV
jgi:alcohol dehydrogenase class IV